MRTNHRTITAALAAALLTLGLSACGSGSSSDDAVATDDQVTTGPVGDAVETPAESPSPTKPAAPQLAIYKFGQTATLPSGLTVQVGKLHPFTPSRTDAYKKSFHSWVKFDVTITNGTARMYNGSDYSSDATTGSLESDEVFTDTMGGGPSVKVLPGHAITFSQAYSIDPKADFVFSAEPTWSGKAVTFAS